MSSPSWDFPSPSANPGLDDDDEREQIEALERELLEQLERDQNGAPGQDHIEALERLQREEQQEREQVEALEREQLAQMAQVGPPPAAADVGSADPEGAHPEAADLESADLGAADFEAADFEAAEQAERDQLEELERESLRQLEQLERQQSTSVAAAPPPPTPPPAPRPRPDAPTWDAPAAPVVETRPGPDAKARAAQFLAEANARQALEEAARGGPPSGSSELREADERSRAARTIVEHRHQNLVEANALLTEARRVLAPIAYRGLSDRTYLRRKIILGIGEAVSLAVAFSAAFDVAPLEGLLLSGAIALAFVIAGDLGGVLRNVADRSRLSAAIEDDAVHLDPRYHHILYHARQPWLSMIGGGTAAVFAVATVSVGVLRAANRGSVGLAAGLGLLTLSLAIAAGLSSWQHASIGSEIIDHLQREEEAAARRLKRAASNRALRRPQIMTAASSQGYDLPSRAPDMDWSAPDVDWQAAPTAELPALRPERAGRARRVGREKPAKAKRERASGSLVGSAAARGAVFLATLPGKLRRAEDAGSSPSPTRESKKVSKRESKIEDMSVSGDGPGALGESAGPIEAVAFRPPIQSPKKFG
ncbi:MAG: hypothetical protein QOG82_1954 [Actinomycetota bacterium]|nr:hypothetical protein [Actinomycetota bacterium]